MAYCQYCGTNLELSSNFCPNCGAALSTVNVQQSGQQTNQQFDQQWSNTARTVGTVASAAVGVSLLGRLFHRRRRPPMMPPHRGHMGGPGMRHGPMGGPGGRR